MSTRTVRAAPSRASISVAERAEGRGRGPAGLANLLSASRMALTPVFLAALCGGLSNGSPVLKTVAAALFCLVCLTDFLDGPAARRLGRTSPLGERLDLAADSLFLLTSYVALAAFGVVPFWLPAAVAFKLVDYVVTSRFLRRAGEAGAFVADPLGRAAAFTYFAVLGVVLVNGLFGSRLFDEAGMKAVYGFVLVLTAASFVHRGVLVLRAAGAHSKEDSTCRGR